jgi:chromosome segregation ATPase
MYPASDSETSPKQLAQDLEKSHGTSDTSRKSKMSRKDHIEPKDAETVCDNHRCSANEEILRKVETIETTLVKIIDTISNLYGDVAKQKSVEKIIKITQPLKCQPDTHQNDFEIQKNLERSENRSKELQHLLEKSELRCKDLQYECGNHLIKQSQLESQLSVLNEKVNCAEIRHKHLSKEMDSLQEVITTKNEIIMDQERHIKNLNNEISKLHDSLIHEKIHASRVDDSLFEQNVNNRQNEAEPQQRRAVNKQNQPDHNAELHQGRAVNILNNRQNPPDAEPQVDNKSKADRKEQHDTGENKFCSSVQH